MKIKIENNNGIDYMSFKPKGLSRAITIPVITQGSRDKNKCWSWNGDYEKPTVRPSVLHRYYCYELNKEIRIHLWLNDGVCKCLSDCSDEYKNKLLQLEDL